MNYCTWQECAKRYASVAKAEVQQNFTDAYIVPATAWLDGFFANLGYAVQFTSVPGIVRDLCIDIASYKFMVLMDKTPDKLKKSIDERLQEFKDGNMVLVDANGVIIASSGNAASLDKSYHSVFGPDSAIHWNVDTDAISDARADRLGDGPIV